ncbi:MAG: DUF547 domain-containing protein [Rhodospirillales bacterium]|nr:DUF547 domain-containing protein [Rhodospirillales bacterium]
MLSGFTALDALFAPKAELWERWSIHDPQSTQSIDHSAWDRFLKAYVHPDPDGLNRVAYGRVTGPDKKALKGYLGALAVVPVSRLNRAEQLAYWINAYNALTVDLIIDHYPVESITDIDLGGGGFFSSGPWSKPLFPVEGTEVALNDIEHRILRPIWQDPRLHYALNCASVGCPNLQPAAFTALLVESMLEDGATAFVNGPRNVRIIGENLSVSKIYSWFQGDFGGSEGAVLDHLRHYANPDLFTQLDGHTSVSTYSYDWTLNEGSD